MKLGRRLRALVRRGAVTVPLKMIEVPFVGRTGEFAELERGLQAAAGSRQLLSIWLSGDAGNGKTRIAERLCRLGALRGWRTIFIERPKALASAKFSGAAAMLQELDRQASEPTTRQLLEYATKEVPSVQRSGDIIEGLLLQFLTTQCVNAIRRESTSTPLILVLDNYQWLDPLSQQVLAGTISQLADANLLFLGISRDERTPTPFPIFMRVHLGPLSNEEVSGLLTKCLDVFGLTEQDVNRAGLMMQSLGRPLFVIELVRDCAREVEQGGSARGDSRVPESLEQLVRERFDGLSVNAKVVAFSVALSSDLAVAEFLRPVTRLRTHEMDISIAELVSTGFVRVTDSGLILFQHEAFRDVVTAAMPTVIHAKFALRAANALRKYDPSNFARVAEFLLAAGERGMASMYYRRASRVVLRRGQYADAVRFLQDAVRCVNSERIAQRTLPELTHLLLRLGRFHDVRSIEGKFPEIEGSLAVRAASIGARLGAAACSLEVLRQDADQLRTSLAGADSGELPACLAAVAGVAYELGDRRTQRTLIRDALLASPESAPALRVELLSFACKLMAATLDARRASKLADEAIAIARESGDSIGELLATSALGVSQLRQGNAKRAICAYRRVIAIGEAHQMDEHRSAAQNNLGLALLENGNFDWSEDELLAALQSAPLNHQMYAAGNLALRALHIGRLSELEHYVDHMLQCNRFLQAKWAEAAVWTLHGLAAVQRRQYAIADKYALALEPLIRQPALRNIDTSYAELLIAGALVRNGMPLAAAERLRRAARRQQRVNAYAATRLINGVELVLSGQQIRIASAPR